MVVGRNYFFRGVVATSFPIHLSRFLKAMMRYAFVLLYCLMQLSAMAGQFDAHEETLEKAPLIGQQLTLGMDDHGPLGLGEQSKEQFVTRSGRKLNKKSEVFAVKSGSVSVAISKCISGNKAVVSLRFQSDALFLWLRNLRI